jgi:hypothetical protein
MRRGHGPQRKRDASERSPKIARTRSKSRLAPVVKSLFGARRVVLGGVVDAQRPLRSVCGPIHRFCGPSAVPVPRTVTSTPEPPAASASVLGDLRPSCSRVFADKKYRGERFRLAFLSRFSRLCGPICGLDSGVCHRVRSYVYRRGRFGRVPSEGSTNGLDVASRLPETLCGYEGLKQLGEDPLPCLTTT